MILWLSWMCIWQFWLNLESWSTNLRYFTRVFIFYATLYFFFLSLLLTFLFLFLPASPASPEWAMLFQMYFQGRSPDTTVRPHTGLIMSSPPARPGVHWQEGRAMAPRGHAAGRQLLSLRWRQPACVRLKVCERYSVILSLGGSETQRVYEDRQR